MSSRPIDEKIAKLSLDSAQFEKNASNAMKTFNDMNKAFSKSSSVDLSNLEKSVDSISGRFTLLGNIGQAAFQRIANTVLNLAGQLNNIFGLGGVMSGFAEYELKLGSIQTIMVNTGESIDTVSAALNELNEYADQTIYSFSDMTRNIGLFTAAGVDLQTSVSSIKGLANLSAGMGVSNEAAARATWQLSQALGTGYVRLQDWISVENAGLGGTYFQKALVEHANEIGALGLSYEELTAKYGTFRNSLTEGAWLTNDVLAATLEDFANDQTLQDAATKVKSFSQLVDTVRESVGSGWAQTWELIFGNLEEAKEFWTPISDAITGFVNKSSEARNKFIGEWKELGGLQATFNGLSNILKGLQRLFEPIKKGLEDLIPDVTPKQLADLSKSFEELTAKFANADFSLVSDGVDLVVKAFEKLKETFSGVLDVLKQNLSVDNLLKGGLVLALISIVDYARTLADKLGEVFDMLKSLNIFDGIKKSVKGLTDALQNLTNVVNPFKVTAIAAAVMMLAFGMESLSKLDYQQATNSLIFMGGIMAELVIAMNSMTGVSGASSAVLLSMAVAIRIIVGALDSLSGLSLEDAAKSVATIGALMLILSKTMASISKNATLLTDGAVFTMLAISISILASALTTLSNIKATSLVKAVIGIAASMAILVKAMNSLKGSFLEDGVTMMLFSTAIVILSSALSTLSQIKSTSLLKAVTGIAASMAILVKGMNSVKGSALVNGATMVLFSTSMVILSNALETIAAIKSTSLLKAVGGIAASLIMLVEAVKRLPKNDIQGAGSILALSASLAIMSKALQGLSGLSLESALISVGALSAVLAALVIAVGQLDGANSLLGSASIAVLSASLVILAGALALLAQIPLEGLGMGLLALGGGLAIMVGLGTLAVGAAPGLLALAAALASVGLVVASVGAAAAGIGTLIGALISLSEAISEGNFDFGSVITNFIQGILEGIPLAIEAITTFIISLITALGEAVPQIIEATLILAVNLIEGLAQGIREYGPRLGEALVELLAALGETLLVTLQSLITRLVEWIQNDGLTNLLNMGIQLVMALINGILSMAGQLLSAGWTAITNFISGIGSWIGEVWNKGVEAVTNFINGIASWFSNIYQTACDAVSEFVSGIGSMISNVWQAGVDIITGFIDGIKSWWDSLWGAGEDSANEAKDGMESVDSTSSGENFVQGFINGMNNLKSTVSSVASTIGSVAKDALDWVLSIFSPSRETEESGEYFDQGFINGIVSKYSKIKQAAVNAGKNAMNGLDLALSRMSSQSELQLTPSIVPIMDDSGIQKLQDLNYSYDLQSLLKDKLNPKDTELYMKIVNLLQSMNNKFGSLEEKLENIKLYLHLEPQELNGEVVTDAVDEIHSIRELLDNAGKGIK